MVADERFGIECRIYGVAATATPKEIEVSKEIAVKAQAMFAKACNIDVSKALQEIINYDQPNS